MSLKSGKSNKTAHSSTNPVINDIKIEESSGNIFADLGLSNPEERLAIADLIIQVNKIIQLFKSKRLKHKNIYLTVSNKTKKKKS